MQDGFEIVDVAKSQIQAYLTDMMHITVLATNFIPTNIANPSTSVAEPPQVASDSQMSEKPAQLKAAETLEAAKKRTS